MRFMTTPQVSHPVKSIATPWKFKPQTSPKIGNRAV